MFFSSVQEIPLDPVFGLSKQYEEDSRKQKVDLGIGIYREEDLSFPPFKAIEEAKKIYCNEKDLAKYQPIEGNQIFTEEFAKIIFGKELFAELEQRVVQMQTVAGTNAIRLAGEFLHVQISDLIFLPEQTWANHSVIFQRTGFSIDFYPYYSNEKKGLDFEAMYSSIQAAPKRSIILFHASCHNPTGCDPTPEQWKKLAELCKINELFPLFDLAYLGFGDSFEDDSFSIRHFAKSGLEMIICASCSKILGLYRERVGALYLISENKQLVKPISSHVKKIIRANYSNPPYFGSRLASIVFQSKDLVKIWITELEERRNRISLLRKELIEKLLHTDKDFSFMKNHKGIFSFCNLRQNQVRTLIDRYAIYLLDNGRINISGLNKNNIDHVAKSLCEVI